MLKFFEYFSCQNSDSSISTNWFKKESFSGRFLNYFSLHPLHQKIGIIKILSGFSLVFAGRERKRAPH